MMVFFNGDMEQKHTRQELQEMWARPPMRQIAVCQAKILEAIVKANGRVRISWSGGKDSTFLLYMYCMTISELDDYKNIEVIFADTTNESRGIYNFIASFPTWLENKFGVKINLTTVRPEKSYIEGGKRKRRATTMVDVVSERGVPVLSKETSEAIEKVRRSMRNAGVSFSQIQDYLKPTPENRDYLLALGLNQTFAHILLGWSRKADKFKIRRTIAKKYLPLMWDDAPKVSAHCCNILKKNPINRTKYSGVTMTGEMAEESAQRKLVYLKTGCNGAILSDGTGVSKPMGAMTIQALLFGIKLYGVPLAEDYGEITEGDDGQLRCTGEERTGCVLCGFGIMYDWDRFTRLQKTDPAKIKHAFTPRIEGGLGYLEVCEYVNKHCKGKIQIPVV